MDDVVVGHMSLGKYLDRPEGKRKRKRRKCNRTKHKTFQMTTN